MHKSLIVFTPSGKRGEFEKGSNLLDAARSLGVDLDNVCGGRGICGRCQVLPSEGEFSKFGVTSTSDNISDFSNVEQAYVDKNGAMQAHRRLACCAKVKGDLVIDVPEDSQVHKQVVRKDAELHDLEIDPVVVMRYVEVEEPTMENAGGDLERLIIALKDQWNEDIKGQDFHILSSLQSTLREGDWKITVAIRDGRIIAVYPGLNKEIYGFAVDLGSTTISCHLTNLCTGDVLSSVGAMNPQIRFGEDLMSRVSYVMMNPGGDREMTAVVRDTLNNLFDQAITEAGVKNEYVLETVVVGNPVMHHLFLGINPIELGWAPFALSTSSAMSVLASDLGLHTHTHTGAGIYILPCIAGHVGADAAAVALAEAPHKQDDRLLIVDVGTNAEIIFGNREQLFSCSSPTGPALEGAQISCGQRAAPGAIERVRIDPVTLEPKFSVIGSDLWSDEEGFEASIKKIGVTGICGSGIIEVMAEMYLAGIITYEGIIDGDLISRSDRLQQNDRTWNYILHRGTVEIVVTQTDVRAIQLAKGALWAGCKLLEDKFGDSIEAITLAGAFGSHIDTKYAMVLGLIPDCDLTKVRSAGNAAGTGARMALLSKSSRAEIERLVGQIEKIETAVEPDFQQYFVDAMAIPNKTDPYASLQGVVTLPPRKEKNNENKDSGGRRRRRR